jgi:hypothetical protein
MITDDKLYEKMLKARDEWNNYDGIDKEEENKLFHKYKQLQILCNGKYGILSDDEDNK